jgi:microcystin degradation protein MlrC
MRVGIVCLQQESNTFLERPTTLDDFRRDRLVTGADIVREYGAAHHEVGGFLQGLEEERIQPIPLLAAWTVPGGVITDECYRTLLAMVLRELDAAAPLDGLLVAPHGAAVSEVHRDMDGHWLSVLRERVGPRVPIVSTLDLHANLSQRMVDACDAIIAYRSNPHLDQRQRGVDAARLIARTLRNEVRPTMAAAFPPISMNIERQLTAAPPCSDLFAFADAQFDRGAVSNSCILGFPYADIEEMGSSFIAVTDNDPALARRLADELAEYVVTRKQQFLPELISIDRAVDEALASEGPVTLLDIGDNVGGGSPADGTYILHALHARFRDTAAENGRRRRTAFVCLYDPESVEQATAVGSSARATLTIGGKTDPARHGAPLTTPCTVLSLHAGTFTESAPRHGGKTRFDMGSTALVRTDSGITVQLTSRRTPPFSLNQLIACGLAPASFDVLVAKGVHAPAAAYGPVSKRLIRVNTPGVTTADTSLLTYHHRRKPLYPFEPI